MTESGQPSLIFTVSTVKDSLRNIKRFVQRNQAAGVDHLIIFLETGDDDVLKFLDDHPGVTAIRAQQKYWQGARPKSINGRQRVNANLAHSILATVPSAGWVFHIDGDEVLNIDKAALLAAEAAAVRLPTLEAVSQYKWPKDEVTHFKRRLDQADLTLLEALGVIKRARLGELFRANVVGKSGVRPTLGLWLGIHSVRDPEGLAENSLDDHGMTVLHYDAYSGEEYVRKWLAHAESAGGGTGFRAKRSRTATAFFALMSKESLKPAERKRFARKLYEKLAQDDFETLRRLDMLVEAPKPEYRPTPMPEEDLAHLRLMLQAMRPLDKDPFDKPGRHEAVAQVLRQAADSIKQDAPEVTDRVHRVVDRYLARVGEASGSADN